MLFAYEGFSHSGDCRCFTFRALSSTQPAGLFRLVTTLQLFSDNKVSVQDGPAFCLKLLEAASVGEPSDLERFRNYTIVNDDFQSLRLERERRLAEKARRPPPKVTRKPSQKSNLVLNNNMR